MLEKIKQLCKQRGISLEQMEQEVGLGKRSTYAWKSTSPSVDKVIAVANYFGVSLDYLCGRDNDDNQELLLIFNSLNEQGKEEAMRYMAYLKSNNAYDKKNNKLEMVEGA